MQRPKTARELHRLVQLHDEFLKSLTPSSGLKAIHIANGCVNLPEWALRRWDNEVKCQGDFVYVSDAHYKRSGLYVDYDSLLGRDYDDLLDGLLNE